MNLFTGFCILDGSQAKMVYAKDTATALAGDTYNYLYNQKPAQAFAVKVACKNYDEKGALFSWLDKYATNKWGFALPIINDAKISNVGYGIDLPNYFMKTLCEAPQYEITESDGNARIINNFLTFGNANYAIVRRYVSCLLTSDIEFTTIPNFDGYVVVNFNLIETRN
jgi:hypothetical protein